jgi:hypothetical protein
VRVRALVLLVLAACGSSATPPAEPVAPVTNVDAAAPEPSQPAPDPQVAERERAKQSAMATTAYVFRYQSAARSETWTLWFASGVAVLNVQPDGGAIVQYQGSVGDGDPMAITVEGPTAKMSLSCKRTTREVDAYCDPAAPKSKKKSTKKKLEALDCFHADFKEPMPFGVMPGIVYVADGACAGYRSISP